MTALDPASSRTGTDILNIDPLGFDHMDRRLLLCIIENFDGGPVGVDNLAAAISEERGTIEDVLEPFLIQQGFIQRTPRVVLRPVMPMSILKTLAAARTIVWN